MFINTGIYGDGDLYQSDADTVISHVAHQEAHSHHVAIRLRYTATPTPGGLESFRLLRISLYIAEDSQDSFTYEAFVDKTEDTNHISMILRHTGSEFVVSQAQLTLKGRRTKGKDV